MPLYGNTDSTQNRDKVALTVGSSSINKTIVFVDETEAALPANKNRGLNGPGWWAYYSYVDAEGNTRHKAEKLVAFGNAESNANESLSDDTIAADVANTITINSQPSNVTGAADPYTSVDAFTVVAEATNSGTLTYQWQFQTPTGTRWSNCTGGVFSGGTTLELAITGATKALYDGYKFRVKLNSSNGAPEVISNTATLTFA